MHHHDRFISTLAAIIALREVGNEPQDERRVKRGEDALWKIVGRLGRDDSDTVGFPLLSTALAAEAQTLGLNVPQPPTRYTTKYRKKVMALLSQPAEVWRRHPLTASLEGLRDAINGNTLLEENGSIGMSPATTSAALLQTTDDSALAYMHAAMESNGTGALPHWLPIDIFEIAWSLNHLKSVGAVQPDDPAVTRLTDVLAAAWSPEYGVSYSRFSQAVDVDDTAACLTVLRWAGYDASADVFNYYELDDHFCCYHGETDPSPSAHVRILLALRSFPDHPKQAEWIRKTLTALQNFDQNGVFWWDKWHASPYYVTSTAVIALRGIADEVAKARIEWLLRTQNDDGGWGYLDVSTPEETAYVLDALLTWHRQVEPLPDGERVLRAAYEYLLPHMHDEQFHPIWIGKTLYSPINLVRAAILSALYHYLT